MKNKGNKLKDNDNPVDDTALHDGFQTEKLTYKGLGRKYRRAGYIFSYNGIILILASFIYNSKIFALVGLGFTLYGALFLFIESHRYVRQDVFEHTYTSTLLNLDRILNQMNYSGKGVHLPPRQLEEFKEQVLYIPKDEDNVPESVYSNLNGMLITPLGQDLLNLYEESMGKDFSKTSLDNLEKNLAQILIENLEVVESINVNIDTPNIDVRISSSIIGNLCKKVKENTDVCDKIAEPFCSSIACAIAKITGKPVRVETTNLSSNSKMIEVRYILIE